MLGFINIIASRRQYLLNTGKIGEWCRLLRAAFVVLLPGGEPTKIVANVITFEM